MNRIVYLIVFCFAFICSCDDNNSNVLNQASISFSFNHHWDNIPVDNSDFNNLKFVNENGETLSIERLRYLISNIIFTTSNGEKLIVNGYHLVDLQKNESLTYLLNSFIPEASYNNVSFTFGFTNEDNIDAAYSDLNSSSWGVPSMLGGGYHYMQLDGKFINSSMTEQGYNYHAIRAVDNPGANPTFPKDTFFTVNLGSVVVSNNSNLNIEMNIAEWFKSPNTWDLNQYNQSLMGNSAAQIMMFENGQNVFSLKSVN